MNIDILFRDPNVLDFLLRTKVN